MYGSRKPALCSGPPVCGHRQDIFESPSLLPAQDLRKFPVWNRKFTRKFYRRRKVLRATRYEHFVDQHRSRRSNFRADTPLSANFREALRGSLRSRALKAEYSRGRAPPSSCWLSGQVSKLSSAGGGVYRLVGAIVGQEVRGRTLLERENQHRISKLFRTLFFGEFRQDSTLVVDYFPLHSSFSQAFAFEWTISFGPIFFESDSSRKHCPRAISRNSSFKFSRLRALIRARFLSSQADFYAILVLTER